MEVFDGTPMFGIETEYLFSRQSRVRRQIVGAVAEGFRVNVYTESGEVRGPRLNGTAGEGADWFTIRRDGVGTVDSRVIIHSESGALICAQYTGTTDFGPDGYDRIMRGDLPTPGRILIAARFQTADPGYAWLNRVQAVGVGMNQGDGNQWDIYVLR
jgi:hypothetical protein